MRKFTFLLIGLLMAMSIPVANAEPTTASLNTETITSVVQLHTYDTTGVEYLGWGSGFLMSPDALILTNAHVVLDPYTGLPTDYLYICYTYDEYSAPSCDNSGRVLAYDENLDLAVVYPAYLIDENWAEYGDFLDADYFMSLEVPYVDFADDWPSIGDPVTVYGYPGASLLTSITLTTGVVSGFNFYDTDWLGEFATDATINPGNSGGPVYDTDERVLGVASAYSTNVEGGSYGYVISNQTIFFWFLDLVDQGLLNEEFVNTVFSNDYVEQYEDYDYQDVEIFTDVQLDDANAGAISYLKNEEIVSGYSDGSFKPENSLNRAELMKILVEGAGYDPDPNQYNNCFPDVGDEWFAKYVCFAAEQDWVEGYPDGFFKPSDNVLKVEALKMLLEVFDIYSEAFVDEPAYEDTPSGQWYSKYVDTAYFLGLLEESGSNYYPANNITRGGVSENLYRLLVFLDTYGYATYYTDDEDYYGYSDYWNGFDIYYPADWTFDFESEGVIVSFWSQLDSDSDPFYENANVTTEDLSGNPGITLEEYGDAALDSLSSVLPGYALEERGDLTLDSNDAEFLLGTYSIDGLDLKVFSVYTIVDDFAWVLTFAYEASEEEQFAEIESEMIESFYLFN